MVSFELKLIPLASSKSKAEISTGFFLKKSE
jgi:hypothetical protein